MGTISVRSASAGPRPQAESIELARKRAADAGVGDRVAFELATALTFGGEGYGLVTVFDCLHDMGDPVGAARHVREVLDVDGTWVAEEAGFTRFRRVAESAFNAVYEIRP